MMFKRLSHQRFQEKKYLTLGYEATPWQSLDRVPGILIFGP